MLILIFALLSSPTTHQIDFALQPLRPTRYNHTRYTNQRKDAEQKYYLRSRTQEKIKV